MKLENFSRGYAHNEEEVGFHSNSLWMNYTKMNMAGRPDRG